MNRHLAKDFAVFRRLCKFQYVIPKITRIIPLRAEIQTTIQLDLRAREGDKIDEDMASDSSERARNGSSLKRSFDTAYILLSIVTINTIYSAFPETTTIKTGQCCIAKFCNSVNGVLPFHKKPSKKII